jgi:hypothetical protein
MPAVFSEPCHEEEIMANYEEIKNYLSNMRRVDGINMALVDKAIQIFNKKFVTPAE